MEAWGVYDGGFQHYLLKCIFFLSWQCWEQPMSSLSVFFKNLFLFHFDSVVIFVHLLWELKQIFKWSAEPIIFSLKYCLHSKPLSNSKFCFSQIFFPLLQSCLAVCRRKASWTHYLFFHLHPFPCIQTSSLQRLNLCVLSVWTLGAKW